MPGFVSLWGDLANDGFLDLVLQEGSVPEIYRNNGAGAFTNVTKSAGLNEPPSWGATRQSPLTTAAYVGQAGSLRRIGNPPCA